MTSVYNNNKYVNHMICDKTVMNHVYTQCSKDHSLSTMMHFERFVYRYYKCRIKIIHLDNEISVIKNFKRWAAEKEIIIERLLSYIKKQNNIIEQSDNIIIMRVHIICIAFDLSENLWSKHYKNENYLLYRISMK